MASINPTQDYDAIHTLTFTSASGTCKIRLYRGSSSAYTGTVYYRAGTSGAWTSLSVSGDSTTFPVTSTTMQVAHDWNKSGNNYMTPSFSGQSTNLVGISISQKAALSGTVGNYFMYGYAYGCSSLTSLSVPDTSGLTSVGISFMESYASDCSKLTSLSVPDTSGLTSVGDFFMYFYASDCSSLTSLSVPDTSGLTSVGDYFMYCYADSCTSLTSLSAPDTSGLTSVGDSFMSAYAYGCSSLTSLSVPDTSGLTSVGDFFMYCYAYNCANLTSLGVPDTSGLTSVGINFMSAYAYGCSSLTSLILPAVGWFAGHDINWSIPSGRLGYLKGYASNVTDRDNWRALTTSTSPNTLYINYIRSADDVILPPTPVVGEKYALPPFRRA